MVQTQHKVSPSWPHRTICNVPEYIYKQHLGGGKVFLGMNWWLCLPDGLLDSEEKGWYAKKSMQTPRQG